MAHASAGSDTIVIAGCGWVRREANRRRKSGPLTWSDSCQARSTGMARREPREMTRPDGGQESTQCKNGTRQPWTGDFGYRRWLLGYERQPGPTEGAPRDDWAHRGAGVCGVTLFDYHAGRAKGEPVLLTLAGGSRRHRCHRRAQVKQLVDAAVQAGPASAAHRRGASSATTLAILRIPFGASMRKARCGACGGPPGSRDSGSLPEGWRSAADPQRCWRCRSRRVSWGSA
jgi:hypothetical protein